MLALGDLPLSLEKLLCRAEQLVTSLFSIRSKAHWLHHSAVPGVEQVTSYLMERTQALPLRSSKSHNGRCDP